MQAARTGDEPYCNWVKDTLALLYLKEGLEVFVDQQSNAFHNQLKAAMGAHTCTCTWHALTRGKRTWEVKHCPSSTCQSWLGLILSHHRNRPFPQLTPENTDPALWPTVYWEVMKVYQPRGCRDQHSAKEADVAGILTILNKCDHFWTFIANLDDIDDLLQLRNRLIHSSDYLVETPETTNDLQFMVQFLRGLKSLSPAEYQPVQTAIDKIEELRANKLDLSLNRELELKAIRAKQAALESKVGAVDRLVQTHNTEIKTHQREHQMHKRELQTHHGELHTHTKKLKTQESELKTQKTELQTHHRELRANRTDLEDHDKRLSTCQTEQLSHQSLLQTHEAKLEDQDTRLLSCQTELKSHHQKLTNLEERMDTPKADNGCEEITEADIADLRTSLIQHYRQHCLKVPNPVVAEEIVMKEIYVRPDIKVLRETNNPETGLLNVQNKEAPENASICKQLFYTDDYKNKQIYVTSDAGMGKTLFCKHLTNMWCSAHTDACSGYSEEDSEDETYTLLETYWSCYGKETEEENDFSSETDTSTEDDIIFSSEEDTDEETDPFDPKYMDVSYTTRTEDIARKYKIEEENCKILSDFKLLFFITLRDSMQQYSIAEMVDSQILRYIKFKKKLKASDILENEGCLVIVDGLDEWVCPEEADVPHFVHPGIPGRLGSNRNTVYLITTRPWKFDVLNLTSSDVDKHVELVGLNNESAKRLCSKLSKLFTGCQSVDIAWNKIWTELERKGLTRLCTIPVLFTQLICLWFDKQELGKSQVQLYCSMLEMMLKRPDKNLRNRKPPALPKPDGAVNALPDCFSNLPYCQAHQNLLLSLCKVAFEALFNEKREDSLVIDSSQSQMFGLDEECTERCLQFGILSQNKVLGKWSVSEKKISFLHKKVQEFLAALFIIINDDQERVSQVTSFCSTAEKVLEMSQVWMFMSGLRPDLSKRLVTDLLTRIVFKDEQLQQYRKTGTEHFYDENLVAASIQTCIVDCVIEANRNGHHDFCLPLEDFIVTVTTLSQCLKSLLISNIVRVKSFFLWSANNKASEVDFTQCLQKLALCDVSTVNFDNKALCETILKHDASSSLTCLSLRNITLTSELSAAVCGMVKHLMVLDLRKVELAHEDREQLSTSVSQAYLLRRLFLGLRCKDHNNRCNSVPDLSGHTRLRSVCLAYANVERLLVANCVEVFTLCYIIIPEDELKQLLHKLSTSSQKVTVALYCVTVIDAIPTEPYFLPNLRKEVNKVIAKWERILQIGIFNIGNAPLCRVDVDQVLA